MKVITKDQAKKWTCIPAHTTARIANICSRGVNWIGSTKRDILIGIVEPRRGLSTETNPERFAAIMDRVAPVMAKHLEAMKMEVDRIIAEERSKPQ